MNIQFRTPKIKRQQVLRTLVDYHGWKFGAEIGVMDGTTMFHLLDKCPQLAMCGVDKWQAGEEYADKNMKEIEGHVAHRARWYKGRCKILKGSSSHMAGWVPDGSLDFVFIDADHSYDAVKQDIWAWLPKLNDRGSMLGHDIDWPGVKSAVEERFGGYELLPDDVWWVENAKELK